MFTASCEREQSLLHRTVVHKYYLPIESNVNSVTYLLIHDMCEVIYQTWETVFHGDMQSIGISNNEKGVENTMCSLLFLMKFEVFG